MFLKSVLFRIFSNMQSGIKYVSWVFQLHHTTYGVQDTVPQNIAPWHIAYLKLKEFKKTAEAERSLSLTSPITSHTPNPLPFTPEAGYKTFM